MYNYKCIISLDDYRIQESYSAWSSEYCENALIVYWSLGWIPIRESCLCAYGTYSREGAFWNDQRTRTLLWRRCKITLSVTSQRNWIYA